MRNKIWNTEGSDFKDGISRSAVHRAANYFKGSIDNDDNIQISRPEETRYKSSRRKHPMVFGSRSLVIWKQQTYTSMSAGE